MKSSPYVYPYLPFANLSQKTATSTFLDRETVAAEAIRSLVDEAPQPSLTPQGESVADTLLEIFINDGIRFGDRELIMPYAEYWKGKFNVFIQKNAPVLFTLLGFPFKVPVPLKTNRVLPDMGEALILKRLSHIVRLIRAVYPPGARIVSFTEGAFGTFAGVSKEETDAYAETLTELVGTLEFSNELEIRTLSEMERSEDFPALFEKRAAEFESRYASGDPEFMKAYRGAYESISRIVSTRGIPRDILMDVYNETLDPSEATEEVRTIREDIALRAHVAVIRYHAYLKVRDDLNFLERAVPNALALSVSPKPYRLGIQPIGSDSVRLPYHAVPVFDVPARRFTLEYLVDIERTGRKYTPVHLERDPDPAPFLYKAS